MTVSINQTTTAPSMTLVLRSDGLDGRGDGRCQVRCAGKSGIGGSLKGSPEYARRMEWMLG